MSLDTNQHYGGKQLGSRALGLSVAAVYLVLSVAGGALLTTTASGATAAAPVSEDERPAVTSPPAAVRATTTAATTTPPTGFVPVTGPNGQGLVLPPGWTTTAGAVATTVVASDPAVPEREIRFGGAPPEGAPTLLARVESAAAGHRENRAGYELLALRETSFHGAVAVEWEYFYSSTGGPRRVAALFWTRSGIEYIVYASSTPQDWPEMRNIFDTVTAHATP
jgi:hypothetical protein